MRRDGERRSRAARWRRARAAVFGGAVACVAASLVWHTGGGTLSAWGVSSVAAVCPVGILEAMAGSKTFQWHPLVLLLAVAAVTLVTGKAFCAWLCPTPYVRRLLRGKKRAEEPASKEARGPSCADGCGAAHVADALAVEGGCAVAQDGVCDGGCAGGGLAPVGGKRDGVRLDGRHAVLAGAVGSAAVFGFPVFCLVCPVGLTCATFVGLWHLFQYNETSWGLLVFPAVLVLEVAVLRKWCTTLCPISALLSLLSAGNRTCRPRVDAEKCLREQGVDCRACVEACPEQVDPHSARIPECSKCGDCAAACPAQAIAMKLLPGKKAARRGE